MSADRIKLTAEQAESLIVDGDEVHTFRAGGMALIGADWDRADVLELLKNGRPEFGGEQCRAFKHGVVVSDRAGWLFIATKPDIDWDAEEAEAKYRMENPQ